MRRLLLGLVALALLVLAAFFDFGVVFLAESPTNLPGGNDTSRSPFSSALSWAPGSGPFVGATLALAAFSYVAASLWPRRESTPLWTAALSALLVLVVSGAGNAALLYAGSPAPDFELPYWLLGFACLCTAIACARFLRQPFG